MVSIDQRIILSIRRINWIIFCIALAVSLAAANVAFTLGVFFGGLIVTVNFQLLARTLRKSLSPPYIASHHIILAKYYLRFLASGVIVFFLIRQHVVNPLGLVIGLSVVVASIMLATIMEIKRQIFKEAV